VTLISKLRQDLNIDFKVTFGRTHSLNFEDVRPFSRQRRNGNGKKTAGEECRLLKDKIICCVGHPTDKFIDCVNFELQRYYLLVHVCDLC